MDGFSKYVKETPAQQRARRTRRYTDIGLVTGGATGASIGYGTIAGRTNRVYRTFGLKSDMQQNPDAFIPKNRRETFQNEGAQRRVSRMRDLANHPNTPGPERKTANEWLKNRGYGSHPPKPEVPGRFKLHMRAMKKVPGAASTAVASAGTLGFIGAAAGSKTGNLVADARNNYLKRKKSVKKSYDESFDLVALGQIAKSMDVASAKKRWNKLNDKQQAAAYAGGAAAGIYGYRSGSALRAVKASRKFTPEAAKRYGTAAAKFEGRTGTGTTFSRDQRRFQREVKESKLLRPTVRRWEKTFVNSGRIRNADSSGNVSYGRALLTPGRVRARADKRILETAVGNAPRTGGLMRGGRLRNGPSTRRPGMTSWTDSESMAYRYAAHASVSSKLPSPLRRSRGFKGKVDPSAEFGVSRADDGQRAFNTVPISRMKHREYIVNDATSDR